MPTVFLKKCIVQLFTLEFPRICFSSLRDFTDLKVSQMFPKQEFPKTATYRVMKMMLTAAQMKIQTLKLRPAAHREM